ncbi:MAG TPA: flagellar export chaperone FliS [Candidatus Latescibacteria bacterium]|jgi:flagellar biosynthetic protein FliS|nr:flagellar export chaperone FliS [Gemmatimonadota bacterium]HCV24002.1 flagellar export chaperone FliS [Candidatus Latescibacterota bacterium]HJN30222.1 flagellar export chaperone FliS [Candidatus Latescibacterota bacterium]|tara:strand:- start:1112 stop:1582 length:471 start_codon:yes stop_codon:yes gene_type:complete
MVNHNRVPFPGGSDGLGDTLELELAGSVASADDSFVDQMPWAPAVLSDKGLFLLLLYEKAISCMDESLVLMDEGDMVGKGDCLIHAQEIVLQLSDALDKSTGAIADNLERLYLYVYRRLIQGNVRLDQGAITEARRIMNDLLEAWQAIILTGQRPP